MWYTDRELLTMFVQCLSSGGNLLWNVGPYANGELPTRYKEQTRRLGDWVRRNRKAIYGTRPARFEFAYGGFQTVKGNRLYLFFLFWPGKEYSLPGFTEKLRSARFVDGGGTVDTVQEPHRIVMKNLPSDAPDPCTVVELTFDAPPTVHEWAACRLHNYPMPPMAEWARL